MSYTYSTTIGESAQKRQGSAKPDVSRKVFDAVLFLFIADTLLDPADLLLGLKLPLYVICWLSGFVVCTSRRHTLRISINLVMYCLVMIFLPLVSILIYQLLNGRDQFEGFQLLKAYLFISMALLLYVTRTNVLPHLAAALTLLAGAIFAVTALVFAVPDLLAPAYAFGELFGIFSIDSRDYGGGIVMFQMYFKTSSMLVVSAAYYFHKGWFAQSHKKTWWFLCLFSLVGMVVAGTRNNILVALLLPLVLTFLYSKKKLRMAGVLVSLSLVAVVALFDKIAILFSPVESSNRIKLDMLDDYAAIFSNPINLWLGRGLGAYEKWTGPRYAFITELTYFEIVRNYGLAMGLVLLALLIFPIVYGFVLKPSYGEKNIIIAYAMYLLMSATNPLFFSSTGILILSAILANIFLYQSMARSRHDAI